MGYMYEDPNTNFIASKNLFEPLSQRETPIFDEFSQDSDGLLYSGIGALIDPKNQFVFPILRAEQSTVSMTDVEQHDEIPSTISEVSGEQLSLVAGY